MVGSAEYRLDLASRAAGPAFEVHESRAAPPGDWDAPVVLPELFAERLNELHPDGRAGLLRADAVRYADGRTDLALTWLHMLFDGWGSERFVEFLAACGAGTRAPDAVPAADRPGAPPDVALPAASGRARQHGDGVAALDERARPAARALARPGPSAARARTSRSTASTSRAPRASGSASARARSRASSRR